MLQVEFSLVHRLAKYSMVCFVLLGFMNPTQSVLAQGAADSPASKFQNRHLLACRRIPIDTKAPFQIVEVDGFGNVVAKRHTVFVCHKRKFWWKRIRHVLTALLALISVTMIVRQLRSRRRLMGAALVVMSVIFGLIYGVFL
ncbi:MAG: hypothetical protein K2Z81_03470 [Cyanobacteria bacterium]|nr:hypothetical protein [Cyanobacteriota bacterium]